MSGKRAPYQPNGHNAAEIRAIENARRDIQPLTTLCALCDWRYEGTAHEGRELAKGHRRVQHPDLLPVRRRRNTLTRHNPRTNDGFREDSMEKAAEVAAMHARRDAAA